MQRVALYYYCKTSTGWKHFPAAQNKLKKVRPRYAQVGDTQVLYPEGHYELRHYVNRRAVWKNVGEDATEAYRLQQKEANTLAAKKAAGVAGIAVTQDESRVNLSKKATEYIARQRTRGKTRHAKMLDLQLPAFVRSTGVVYADQLTEAMMLKWYTELQAEGNGDYTIRNKHINVFGFLKWCGVKTKPLAPDGPPTYTVRAVNVYTPEELKVFFDSLSKPYHHLVFDVLMKTGMREQEAAFLEWEDFDFERGTVTLRKKPELHFDLKARYERMIPVPESLTQALLAWRKENPKTRFVLGNSKDKPNGEWLPMMKRLVEGADLRCKKCKTCLGRGECGRWNLKKFRSTYATTMLRNGVDPVTLMSWTGHKRMETIMLYMAPAEAVAIKTKVDSVVWTREATRSS